jgi:hypothetical protein
VRLQPPGRSRVLGALFFVFAAEIALARFTSEPLAWGDLAISAGSYLLLALAAAALLTGRHRAAAWSC